MSIDRVTGPRSTPPKLPAVVETPSPAHAGASSAAEDASRTQSGEGVQQAAAGASQLQIPDWVKDAVFYQIFPERFENGDLGNDPQGVEPWGSTPRNESMMGGDLNGIAKRMDYLTKLGVNALYLNPVFAAPSNHKYNTTDYTQVDEDFGGNAAFTTMMDAAKERGVKVMLDGVFNHVSHQHPWFRDVREKGEQSPYFDRFDVKQWPISYTRDKDGVLRSDDYHGWWGYASLPVLKTDHPAVREYFLTGPDSIAKRWLREGRIDGWRMDVADDTNFTPDYWRTARTAIKSENPDAYLVAENWKDASEMLQGDQFDGTMNYQYFTFPAVDFFAKKRTSVDDFVGRLQNGYSREAKHGAFNILDSHDTPRFITQAGGDWYRQRPAAIFQMTYIGAPVVYYGDEIGMEGGADPDARRAMEWQYAPVADASGGADAARAARARQLFDLYQKLIETRKAEPALRRGDFHVLATHNDDNTLVYRRALEGEQRDAIVAINNNVVGKDIWVPLAGVAEDGTSFTDALSGSTYVATDGGIRLQQVDGNFGAVLLRDV